MKRFLLVIMAAVLGAASRAPAQTIKLSAMTRCTSTTGCNDSALTLITDSATRTRAATIAQLRKALSVGGFDTLKTTSGFRIRGDSSYLVALSGTVRIVGGASNGISLRNSGNSRDNFLVVDNGGSATLNDGTNSAVLSTSTASGDRPAGGGIQGASSKGVYMAAYSGSGGPPAQILYFNQTRWGSAAEVASVASGFGKLRLMKAGGPVTIGDSTGFGAATTGLTTVATAAKNSRARSDSGSTTGALYQQFQNTTGNFKIGIDSATGGFLGIGARPYAGVINVVANKPLLFGTNNTLAGQFDSTGTFSAKGTATNDTATTGWIGEHLFHNTAINTTLSLSTGSYTAVDSVTLSAGDWDCTGVGIFRDTSATTTQFRAAVDSVRAAAPSVITRMASMYTSFSAVVDTVALPTPVFRMSVNGSQKMYLNVTAMFSTNKVYAAGGLRCRRMR